MRDFVDSTPLLADREALTARFRADGHLFFRGLVDPDEVLAFRRDALEALAGEGWLAPDTDSLDALPGPEARHEGSAGFWSGYVAIQRLESFHRLAHDKSLLDAMDVLLGAPVLAHPQKVFRASFPGTEFVTAPHQDYRYIQGTADVITAWLPLGHYPPEHGGLRVLSGSQQRGLMPVSPANGPGGLGVDVDNADDAWRTASYEPGDAVVFHSLTVHAGLPNLSSHLRVSVDYRYQAIDEPICPPSLGPHFGSFRKEMVSWDDLSTTWSSREWVDVPDGLDLARFHLPTRDLDVPPSRLV
jgi:hypothetical protein